MLKTESVSHLGFFYLFFLFVFFGIFSFHGWQRRVDSGGRLHDATDDNCELLRHYISSEIELEPCNHLISKSSAEQLVYPVKPDCLFNLFYGLNMFMKTSILLVITAHFFISTMANNSTSPLDPSRTWTHFRNFLEKKGEFAPEEKKEEPMEIPEGEKYTIVTGEAQGADAYAERLVLAYECKLEIKIGPNHPRAQCISPIVPVYADLLNAQRAATQARKTLERNAPVGKGGYFDELLIRNYFIAKDVYASYAFGYLEPNKTRVQGGTGWTVQLAVDMGKKSTCLN